MKTQLIIHAPNVHSGGGKVLLSELLSNLPDDMDVILQVDDRFPCQNERIQTYRVKPTVFDRLRAEWRLSRLSDKNSLILCFGNLPPLFSKKGNIKLFVQNRYLVENKLPQTASVKERIRLTFERLWLKFGLKNVAQVIVQTPIMASLFQKKYSLQAPPKLLTLVSEISRFQRKGVKVDRLNSKHDFIYVSSGEVHKNHLRLVKAWKILAKEGVFPSLCLTLNGEKYKHLLSKIDQAKNEFGLKIDNIFVSDRKSYIKQLQGAQALIFPSLMESFGLPLVEAREAGLPILASERDFVRDVVDPEETFDPESETSISRAVRRFLRIDEPALPFVTGKEFIEAIR